MNDKQLLRFAIVIALIGLVILFILAEQIETETISIDMITDEYIDQHVVIHGEVVAVTSFESMTLFRVRDALTSILVVVFEPIELEEGNTVTVSGTVKRYKGELEIVAEIVETVHDSERPKTTKS